MNLDGLHPQARAVLDSEIGEASVADTTDAEIAADREETRQAALELPREDVASVVEANATLPGRTPVPVRIFLPEGAAEPAPVIVHLHGGGFVFNDIDVHDGLCRRLANRSGHAVVAVAYRKPPEDPFPAAIDDLDTVRAWLPIGGMAYGLDADRVALHGDSAGACLALASALSRPEGLRALALVYPFIDPHMASASWDEATGLFDRREGGWYWQHYAGPAGEAVYDDPRFGPSAQQDPKVLAALPPTLVVTAEFDPCRGEGEEFALRLAEAGGEVTATRVLGMLHGFYRHADFTPSEPTVRQVAGFLDQHLS